MFGASFWTVALWMAAAVLLLEAALMRYAGYGCTYGDHPVLYSCGGGQYHWAGISLPLVTAPISAIIGTVGVWAVRRGRWWMWAVGALGVEVTVFFVDAWLFLLQA